MIITRKPWTLYDVDVIALAALALIGLTACFGVMLPAGAHASEHTELSAQIASATAAADETGAVLHNVIREINMLQVGIADHVLAAPKPGALTPFLQRVASLSRRCNLRITQVVPEPVRTADGYLTCDVSFSGQGRCLDFARLIHDLSEENPYFSLQSFSIMAEGSPTQPTCKLSWMLRLYMLEDEQPGPDTEARP
jgi:hypothetical protein